MKPGEGGSQRWPTDASFSSPLSLLSCQDIAGRFMAQKKSEENLQQQIAKSEKKRQGLKSQLKALELQRAELKFHQSPGFLRYLPLFVSRAGGTRVKNAPRTISGCLNATDPK